MLGQKNGLLVCALWTSGFVSSISIAQDTAKPLLEPPANSATSDIREVPGGTSSSNLEPLPQYSPIAEQSNPADSEKIQVRNVGPLHEAFLSPAKDGAASHIDKAPPQPINERPAVDPPSENAVWIPGYWEWNEAKKDYLWTTGTYRVPPPGRFWINGYWKRDDQGWYRVPGFWTDRQTDRIDWRKEGPPADQPDDQVGSAPGTDFFYIPGHYAPDANGVIWKKGFWAKSQVGWSWVPAQWVRQPEGWTYQEGYWDRNLEDRGILFAPAEIVGNGTGSETTYAPLTQISPEQYGQLYGAFGRTNSAYDGYPGCFYDNSGRYYGYANYGNIGGYYGYLDYPYTSNLGYPYFAQPVSYYPSGLAGFGGYGGIGAYGIGGGVVSGLFPYGYGGLGYGGLGYGGLGYGGLGYGGLGYGGLGYGGLGYGGLGYGGLGFGGLGFGGLGFGGFGSGFGLLGLGLGGFGLGGYGFGNAYAYNRGFNQGFRQGYVDGRHRLYPHSPNHPFNVNPHLGQGASGIGHQGHSGAIPTHLTHAGQGSVSQHPRNVTSMAPASSHPFANPFRGTGNSQSTRGVGANDHHWTANNNASHQAFVSHSVARPNFSSHLGNPSATVHQNVNHLNNQGTHLGSRGIGSPSGSQHSMNGSTNAIHQLGGQNHGLNTYANQQVNHSLNGVVQGMGHPQGSLGGYENARQGHVGLPSHTGSPSGLGAYPNHALPHAMTNQQGQQTMGTARTSHYGSPGFSAPQPGMSNGSHHLGSGYVAPHANNLGGFSYGHPGGYANHPGSIGAGGMGGLGSGHIGGYPSGHMGGMSAGHMGGMSAGHMGGMSGGHMSGGGGHGGGHH